jgi:hypothetical protein
VGHTIVFSHPLYLSPMLARTMVTADDAQPNNPEKYFWYRVHRVSSCFTQPSSPSTSRSLLSPLCKHSIINSQHSIDRRTNK